MKKFLVKMALACSLVLPSAMFGLAGVFVGGEGNFAGTSVNSGVLGKVNDNIFGYGVRVGAFLGDHRLHIGYYYQPEAERGGYKSPKWNTKKTVIGWDWGIIGIGMIKAMAGLHAGYGDLTEKVTYENESYKVSNSGFLAGFKIGGKLELNSLTELELGFKREWGFYGKPDIKVEGTKADFDGSKSTRQTSNMVYIGFNIKIGL